MGTHSRSDHLRPTPGARSAAERASRGKKTAGPGADAGVVQRTVVSNGPAATPAVSAVAQRVVLSRVYAGLAAGSMVTKYYSSLDPSREFDDLALARAHDRDLEAAAPALARDARYPTNFTYHQEKSHNAVPLSKQGPHTLSHAALAHRLSERVDAAGADLRALRDEQVLTPAQFREAFAREAPSRMNPRQEARATADYDLLYGQLEEMLKLGAKAPREKTYELIMRLMQMNPYTAYGKAKQGKARISGKGERRDVDFENAFDTKARFNSLEHYAEFKAMRQKLFPVAAGAGAGAGTGGGSSAGHAGAAGEERKASAPPRGERKRERDEGDEPSASAASVVPMVHLASEKEVNERSWNAGDRFEIAGHHGRYYVWTVKHHAGTPIAKGDYVVRLRGG